MGDGRHEFVGGGAVYAGDAVGYVAGGEEGMTPERGRQTAVKEHRASDFLQLAVAPFD